MINCSLVQCFHILDTSSKYFICIYLLHFTFTPPSSVLAERDELRKKVLDSSRVKVIDNYSQPSEAVNMVATELETLIKKVRGHTVRLEVIQ